MAEAGSIFIAGSVEQRQYYIVLFVNYLGLYLRCTRLWIESKHSKEGNQVAEVGSIFIAGSIEHRQNRALQEQ